jgi:hypothetical protein
LRILGYIHIGASVSRVEGDSIMKWQFAAFVALLLVVTGAGCNRPPNAGVVVRGPSGTATWNYLPSGGEPVPGIDEGSAYFAGELFVVWSDSPHGTSAGSTDGPNGFSADGAITARDRRRIPFRASSRDGQSGKVVIDGVEYDLAAGRLFLVATGADKVQVKQMANDLSGLRLEMPNFREFAKGEPEIMAFFQPAKK